MNYISVFCSETFITDNYAEVNWHKPLAQTSLQIKHTPDDTGMLITFLPHRLFSAAILEKLCV